MKERHLLQASPTGLLRIFLKPVDYLAREDTLLAVHIHRKDRQQSSDWHFHEGFPLWPVFDYIEVHAPILDEWERLCPDCVKLELPIHNQIGSKYFLQSLAYSLHPNRNCQNTH